MLKSAEIRQAISNKETRYKELQAKKIENLDDEEKTELQELVTELQQLINDLDTEETMENVTRAMTGGKKLGGENKMKPKNLGEQVWDKLENQITAEKGDKVRAFAKIVKNEADTHTTTDTPNQILPFTTEWDRTIVRAYRRPSILSLFNRVKTEREAVSYIVEVGKQGAPATVAEKGQKPLIQYSWGSVTDTFKKIACVARVTTEMIKFREFLVNEIENRMVYDLEMAIEQQVLFGNGTGSNLLGLANRTGVQTETSANVVDNADALFRAKTKIQNATGMVADGIVINPKDYEALRLSKDGNGQYFGGGFFQNQYGNGGIMNEPPIWGTFTMVSEAVPVGQAIVGAWSGATLYDDGGLIVEISDSARDGDFENNISTIRAEEFKLLAVRQPAAFVKVTLAQPVTG